MGIRSGTSTRWFFIHCVKVELEWRKVGFCGEGKIGVPKEKPAMDAIKAISTFCTFFNSYS